MLTQQREVNGAALLNIPQLTETQLSEIRRDRIRKTTRRDGNVLFLEGLASYQGLDGSIDIKSAEEYFINASQLNISDADYCLGIIYYLGEGIEQDYERAAYHWQRAADRGHLYSCNNIGFLHYVNLGVQQDHQLAFEYLSTAVEGGVDVAEYNLALLYHFGLGVTQSHEVAADLYLKQVENGLPHACVNLGVLYLNGLGVEKNRDKAKTFFEVAAKHADLPEAWNMLGVINFSSEKVHRNLKEAIKCFQKAVDLGLDLAHFNLGQALAANNQYSEAIGYLKIAAEAGNVYAQSELSQIYVHGKSGNYDWKAARMYAELAAAQNDSTSVYTLGLLYAHGYGVTADLPRAVAYWEQAGKQGNEYALNNLGVIHLSGQMGEKSVLKALFFYSLAASKGSEEAQKNFDDILQIQKKQAEENPQLKSAAISLEKLVDDGDATVDQKSTLAQLCLLGVGVDYDFEKGSKLAKEAAAAGDENAELILKVVDSLLDYLKPIESKTVVSHEEKIEIRNSNVVNLFEVNNNKVARSTAPKIVQDGEQPPKKLKRVYRHSQDYPNPEKPAQAAENRTTEQITITLSPQLLTQIEDAALEQGLGRGDWFKDIFEKWLAVSANVKPEDFADFKKSSRIQIYLSPQQMQQMRDAAKSVGLKPAEWIRRVSNTAMNLPTKFPGLELN